jgi:hypothetical protein
VKVYKTFLSSRNKGAIKISKEEKNKFVQRDEFKKKKNIRLPLFANLISFSFLTHFESSKCELKFY